MKSGGSYATSLRKLRDAIRKIEPKLDCEKIEQLARECAKIPVKSLDCLISLKEFSFPVKTFKSGGLDHVRPLGLSEYKAILSVKISLLQKPPADVDPIVHLAVNVIITDIPTSPLDAIFCAWHLDSHPPEGSTGPSASAFAHPRYHWQYGGKEVWASTNPNFFGSHLLLESPRLPHPPLDVVLAIDYVFANYYGKQWQKLRSDPEYQRVVKEAQEHYWRPYFATICANWRDTKSNSQAINLIPFFYPQPPRNTQILK